ncbi:MAG: hypothetical protein IT424_00080 [Pirellulales bacterium]|nr:hypothetical protein [Pirellulales bacterium]
MDSNIRRNPVFREQLLIDGVSYEIAAVADEEGCLARWHCARCGLGGQSKVKLPASAAAIEWARNSVQTHHAALHHERGASP